jgi:hypothetical protein
MCLPWLVRANITPARNLPLDVFSYSGEQRLGEQVASIRSLLRHAGRPQHFTVVSDGTYCRRSIDLLRRVDDCVRVEMAPEPPFSAPARFASYLRNHPVGKQLALAMSLPRSSPALYLDSDVMFFPAAREWATVNGQPAAPAHYLLDCGFSGDERLLRGEDEKACPVNVGVFLLRRPLDWQIAVERFGQLSGEPNFFTNQTLTHVVMHANRAQPFDPRKFILQLDDQFEYSDRYAGSSVVLRHYVAPVRHKFWQALVRGADSTRLP